MEAEKRMVGSYEIYASFMLGGKEVLIGIDVENREEKYACFNAERDDLFERYSECVVSDDYLEIAEEFSRRIQEGVSRVREEINGLGLDTTPLSSDSFFRDNYEDDIRGKVVGRRIDNLYPEYQRVDKQIYLAIGGSGAHGNSRGSAVFARCLATGEEVRLERQNIIGVIKPECMPEWAKPKAKLLTHCYENDDKVFNYEGHHFCPYRSFSAAEKTMEYAIRHCGTDLEMGLIQSEKPHSKTPYSHDKFYKAANADKCDLFVCRDNGRLYVPAENEMFTWTGEIGEPDKEYAKGAETKHRSKGQER